MQLPKEMAHFGTLHDINSFAYRLWTIHNLCFGKNPPEKLVDLREQLEEQTGKIKMTPDKSGWLDEQAARKAAANAESITRQIVEELGKNRAQMPNEKFNYIVRHAKAAQQLYRQIAENDFEMRVDKHEYFDIAALAREELQPGAYTDKHGRPVELKRRISAGWLPVPGNAGLVRRVMVNLLTDASIHPETAGRVRLRASVFPTKDGFIRLRVWTAGAKPLTSEQKKKIGHETFTTRRGPKTELHGRGKINARLTAEAHGGSFRALNWRGNPALEIQLPSTCIDTGELEKLREFAKSRPIKNPRPA